MPKMVQFRPFGLKGGVHFGPFGSTKCTVATPKAPIKFKTPVLVMLQTEATLSFSDCEA